MRAIAGTEDLDRDILANITHIITDAIIAADEDQRIVLFNRGAERIFGYKAAEVIGQPLDLLLPPRLAAVHRQHIGQFAAEREAARLMGERREVYGRRKDGSEFPAEASISKLTRDGRTLFTAIMRDISRRKQDEERLRRSEAALANAQAVAHLGSWEWDVPTNVVTWSDELYRLYGLQPQEISISYEGFLERVHPDDRELVQEIIGRAYQTGEPFEFDHRLVRPDGSVRWSHAQGRVILDEAGQPVRMVGTGQDATERKQAEQALQESEERFRKLAENASDLIYRIRYKPEVAIDFISPSMQTILGYSLEEFNADPQLGEKIVHPDDRERNQAVGQAFVQSPYTPTPAHTVRYLHKDGHVVWLEHRFAPVFDAEGALIAVEGMARDITERVEAYLTLEQRVEERTREIERRRQVAESLRDILAVLNSNLPLEAVLDNIVAQAGRLLGADAVAIYRLEDAQTPLAIKAVHGLESAVPDAAPQALIPAGQSAIGQALERRQPVAIANVTGVSAYHALLAVPLIVKDQVYGGIILYYPEPREFAEEEIGLAVGFADQVALALENARLREETEQAAAAAERNRLARDLHDAVTQTLFSSSLIADVLPAIWEHNPEEGRKRLAELRELSAGALAEMRTLLLELRPKALTEMSLAELLRHLTEALKARTRLPIKLTVEGERPLAPQVQIALYRIAQEALNNVARHANATQVSVRLRFNTNTVELRVKDNGRGFVRGAASSDHLGLNIMRERAQDIGADLTITTQVGQGAEVAVVWAEGREAARQ
jgi:PAS domain S-box-containing protein